MNILLAVAVQMAAADMRPTPPCRQAQLSLSVARDDQAKKAGSESGLEISIRNTGSDCTLPALPKIEWLGRNGRVLPAVRRTPPGMHPGPVMLPVSLGGGHRAAVQLRWDARPDATAATTRAAYLRLSFDAVALRAPVSSVLVRRRGSMTFFSQTPLRAMEGMPAG